MYQDHSASSVDVRAFGSRPTGVQAHAPSQMNIAVIASFGHQLDKSRLSNDAAG
jgi:hypothetical protein